MSVGHASPSSDTSIDGADFVHSSRKSWRKCTVFRRATSRPNRLRRVIREIKELARVRLDDLASSGAAVQYLRLLCPIGCDDVDGVALAGFPIESQGKRARGAGDRFGFV